MIGRTRVGFKYLFWGLVIGVLFAPRSGKETRAKVIGKLKSGADALLGLI
jgi:gas vesicle protein